MNNGMVRRLADSLADRIVHDAGHDPQRQIESLYWLAVSRPPTVEEAKASLETLSKLGQIEIKDGQPGKITDIQAESRALAKLCHTVFNSAAFIYID
jgi:hypothetical protein